MRYALAALAVVLLAACTPQAGGGNAAPSKASEPSTWGKQYKWSDGLAVQVDTPTACKPGKYAFPQDVQRAAKFKVTVTNGTDKPFETAVLTLGVDAQFAGAKAERVIDTDGPCGAGGVDNATVLPGKSFSYEVAYTVGAQPGEMQLTFMPGFTQSKAVFVGQA
jgi:hypothetical protein